MAKRQSTKFSEAITAQRAAERAHAAEATRQEEVDRTTAVEREAKRQTSVSTSVRDLGIFGVPRAPGEFASDVNGGYDGDVDYAESRRFHSGPDLNDVRYQMRSDALDLMRSRLIQMEESYNRARERVRELHDQLKNNADLIVKLKDDVADIDDSEAQFQVWLAGPPQRQATDAQIESAHTRAMRKMKAKRHIDSLNKQSKQAESDKASQSQLMLELARQISVFREEFKAAEAEHTAEDEHNAHMPVIVGRSIEDVLLKQESFVTPEENARQAIDRNARRDKILRLAAGSSPTKQQAKAGRVTPISKRGPKLATLVTKLGVVQEDDTSKPNQTDEGGDSDHSFGISSQSGNEEPAVVDSDQHSDGESDDLGGSQTAPDDDEAEYPQPGNDEGEVAAIEAQNQNLVARDEPRVAEALRPPPRRRRPIQFMEAEIKLESKLEVVRASNDILDKTRKEMAKMETEKWLKQGEARQMAEVTEMAVTRAAGVEAKLDRLRQSNERAGIIGALNRFFLARAKLREVQKHHSGLLDWYGGIQQLETFGVEHWDGLQDSARATLMQRKLDDEMPQFEAAVRAWRPDRPEPLLPLVTEHTSVGTDAHRIYTTAFRDGEDALGAVRLGAFTNGVCLGSKELPKSAVWDIDFVVTKANPKLIVGPKAGLSTDHCMVQIGTGPNSLFNVGKYVDMCFLQFCVVSYFAS